MQAESGPGADGGDAREKAEADRRAANKGCLWIVVAIVAFAVLMTMLDGDDDEASPGDDPGTDEFTAIEACHNSVEAQLKAPATAEFGDEVAVRSARGTYEVSGFVDAENGFGAMLRMTWTCDARPTTTGYRGTATVVE